MRDCLKDILRKAALRRDCTVTLDDLLSLYASQSGLCALTGWPMTFIRNAGRVPTNASLDRIDSSLGYHLSNVQLVCRAANSAKSDSTNSDFIALCVAIAAFQELTK